MTADNIQGYVPVAQEALRSFLGTLLGDEAPLEAGEPSEVDATALQDDLDDNIVVGAADQFLVVLDRSWIDLVSTAMLGRSMGLDDEGVDDLFREVASQGYGSIRNQLSAQNVTAPDLTIEPYLPGTAAPPLGDTAWRVPFQLTYDGDNYGGYALLPTPVEDKPESPDSIADDMAQPQSEPSEQAAPAESAPAGQGGVGIASANFSELGTENIHGPRAEKNNFELLSEVELEVSVELGRRRLPLSDVLQLTSGSVIELEKLVGEPLSLYANGRFVAEGEAVVIDEKFGIRITSLAPKRQNSETLT